ncbi:hypothetical protein SSX86_002069 [Deinandra increscens subsp. villosa]|uniref:Uncharacterized protein n=1 Tax=Deinandra increscens subsp. villosa TaxID=3103831 RepID=A0AAP0HAX5_9ASTR
MTYTEQRRNRPLTSQRRFNRPVIFPSGGNPNTAPQRRLLTAPFQPPRSSNPSIHFMSFDIGSSPASTSFSTPQFGVIGAATLAGNANLDDEPPLLEELGSRHKHHTDLEQNRLDSKSV